MKLDKFTIAYIECMFWATNDESTTEGGDPLDENYGIDDIDPKSLVDIINDCRKFQAVHAGDILSENYPNDLPSSTDAHAGYDFWLTRNSHGAGFWDRDWEEGAGKRMGETSKRMGEVCVCVGEDGKIHCSTT